MEVINRGYSGKQNIRVGKGKVSIKSQLVTLGLAATISIELTHVGSAGEVKKGRVLMTGTLLETSAFKVLEPVVIQKINDDTKDELLAQTFGDVGELLDGAHSVLMLIVLLTIACRLPLRIHGPQVPASRSPVHHHKAPVLPFQDIREGDEGAHSISACEQDQQECGQDHQDQQHAHRGCRSAAVLHLFSYLMH